MVFTRLNGAPLLPDLFLYSYETDLLLNNFRFGDFVDRIYSIELEIKNTDMSAYTLTYTSKLTGAVKIETLGQKEMTSIFPFICTNIPAAPAYGASLSQMLQYPSACGSYQDFLDRGLLLTRKLLNQGFLLVKLKSSFRKFYGRHHDLVDRYEKYASQMTTDMFHLS